MDEKKIVKTEVNASEGRAEEGGNRMSDTENNVETRINPVTGNPMCHVFFITKSGNMVDSGLMKMYKRLFDRMECEISSFAMGSAYNDPDYLLEAIEDIVEKRQYYVAVVAERGEEYAHIPVIFVDSTEMNPLVEALEKAGEDGNSWDICETVHTEIRGKEYLRKMREKIAAKKAALEDRKGGDISPSKVAKSTWDAPFRGTRNLLYWALVRRQILRNNVDH